MLKKFHQTSVKVRIIRGLLLAVVVAVLTVFVPTPYWLHAPGRVQEVTPLIEIQTETYPVSGRYLLPTVISEPATLIYCIYSLVDPDAVLTRSPSAQPMAQSPQDGTQMALSQHLSSVVALEAAGYPIRGALGGLRIDFVPPDSPARGALQRGDLIVEIEGEPITSLPDIYHHLEGISAGETVRLSVQREGKTQTQTIAIEGLLGTAQQAVAIHPEWKENPFPFAITIDAGSVVGASGGLVFALDIYDRLTPDDLTRSRRVAATGTLSLSGRVGPIEGLGFKVKGAERSGADILLYPRANHADVANYSGPLRLVPVGSFEEAVDALKE